MLRKKFPLWVVCILCTVSIGVGALGYSLVFPQTQLSKKVAELDRIINDNFDGEISADEVDEAVIKAYLKTLDDKYSAYIPQTEANDYNASYKGEDTGIGLNILNYGGKMLVTAVHTNSPAQKAGILVYDNIYSIDGTVITNENYKDVLLNINAKKSGEVLKIAVERQGQLLNFDITVKPYVKQTVFYEQIDDIGYIKLTHFEEYTVKQFKDALKDLQDAGVRGLIFDVRSNSGGLVSSVSEILDVLVPECDIITAKNKKGETTVMYKSDANEVDLPMAVLTNGDSASASELFTATLREMKNAAVYGEKTYGKGVMQESFTLHDGSIIKITTAKYYSAKDNNWESTGIAPDYEISLKSGSEYMAYIICIDDDPLIKAALSNLKK